MELVQFCSRQGIFFIRLIGDLEFKASSGLDTILGWVKDDKRIRRLVIDLGYAKTIDSTNLGMIAELGLHAHQKHEHMPILCPGAAPQVKHTLSNLQLNQLFRWKGDDEVFGIADGDFIHLLPPVAESEALICDRAIKAHRALVSLGEGNPLEFRGVLAGLHMERALLAKDLCEDQDDDAINGDLVNGGLESMEINQPYVSCKPLQHGPIH